MAGLNKNWLTEKHIDFEYKKYVLLAYLMEVEKNFHNMRLYPWLAELISHYNEAVAVKNNKQTLQKHFPQKLSGITSSGLTYEGLINDDELMQEIENIIEYAIPQFKAKVEEGRSIYDIVEEHLHIQSVGIIPLNPEAGYMFLKGGDSAKTNVYEYQITFWETTSEKYKAIHTHFVKTVSSNISTTFQSIKNDLVRENKKMPNPATYAIETEISIPLEETFLPIAKRMLVRHITRNEVSG